MQHKISRIFFLSVFLLSNTAPAWAEIISTPENFSGAGAEYFVGREYGRPLVTISLLSGVTRPGVYHVPVQTNLVQLIAFAGGTTLNAEVDNIRVRHSDAEKPGVLTYDLNRVMTKADSVPMLQDRDVIQIPQNVTLDSTIKWTTLLAGFASIALSVSLVNQINHHP